MLLGLGWERADPTRLLETFSRNYYRVHFITGGTGYYRTIDETTLLAESEGFVIFPGETPQYYPHEDCPWEYFWMAIRGKEMESPLRLRSFPGRPHVPQHRAHGRNAPDSRGRVCHLYYSRGG